MEKEIWKDVVGYGIYDSIYEVSSIGNVRRKGSQSNLSPNKHNQGYLMVQLSFRNKCKKATIHRIVASAFIPNQNNLPQVNHKDGIKSNNNVENLEWVSLSENMQHAWDNGLMRVGEFSQERRDALRIACSNRFKGIPLSEEHKLKVIESNKGKDHRNKNRADFIHVKCIETNEEFTCIKFAADRFGIKKSELWRHLRLNKPISIPFTFIITREGTKKGGKTKSQAK